MKNNFFGGVTRLEPRAFSMLSHGRLLFRLAVDVERPNQFLEVVARNICDGVHGRRLELFKPSMIKYLGHGALHSRPANLAGHDWAFTCQEVRLGVQLDKWLWVVLLKLILVNLSHIAVSNFVEILIKGNRIDQPVFGSASA